MKKKNQILAALLSAAVMLGIFSSCGQGDAPKEAAPSTGQTEAQQGQNATQPTSEEEELPKAQAGSRIYTDSLGREIELPAEIQSFAPSGALSQLVLYSLAPDKMVGWSSKPTEEMKRYFQSDGTSLPTFGTFYGKNADLNIEALLAAGPQVVIDMGERKENMREDLNALQEQIGIPVVFIEAQLESMGQAYRMLGELLSLPEEAKGLADYCDTTIAEGREKAASIPEDQKVTVYYGRGETGLEANPAGSFHAEVIDEVGGINVADMPKTNGNQVSMEQLLLWEPDVILLDPDSVYDTIGTDPLWKDLKAVQQKRFYQIPSGPYNWMGRPPAVNRMIGVKWLGNLLYPEWFDYDMVSEVKTFYQLFYHYALTDEEANALLASSAPSA